MPKCGIYLIENTVSPLFYIGQSIDIYARWSSHKYSLNMHNRRTNRRLQNSWSKHGADAFSFKILELCEENSLTERECYWLSKYRSEYPKDIANHVGPVDNPMRGNKHSQESLKKISESLKGKVKSDEHRRKIGAAQIGKIVSKESCKKISNAKKGKPNLSWIENGNPSRSPEFKRRFSGDGNPAKRPEVREKMSKSCRFRRGVIDVNSGETWETMSDCAAYLGVSVAAVHAAATKKNPTVKGRVLDRWFNARLHRAAQKLAGL